MRVKEFFNLKEYFLITGIGLQLLTVLLIIYKSWTSLTELKTLSTLELTM